MTVNVLSTAWQHLCPYASFLHLEKTSERCISLNILSVFTSKIKTTMADLVAKLDINLCTAIKSWLVIRLRCTLAYFRLSYDVFVFDVYCALQSWLDFGVLWAYFRLSYDSSYNELWTACSIFWECECKDEIVTMCMTHMSLTRCERKCSYYTCNHRQFHLYTFPTFKIEIKWC